MKPTSLIALVFLLTALLSCKKDAVQYDFGKQGLVSFGTEGNWGPAGKNITVSWNKLIQESRCPIGAECFWEGIAEVSFKVEGIAADPVFISLGTLTVAPSGFSANEMDTLGYHFKLIALNPYPAIGNQMTEKDYQATLVVSH